MNILISISRSNMNIEESLERAVLLSMLISYCCVENYHKCRGLKQHKFIILLFWRSKVYGLKIKVLPELSSFWRLWGESILCFSQLLEAAHLP